MKTSKRLISGLMAVALCVLAPLAQANLLSVSWTDPAGDPGSVGDVVGANLTFDSLSGAWTVSWWADPAHAFTGNARFNLNLFDTALGNPVGAVAPQVSLVGFHNFGSSHATFFSYSGTTPYLTHWHVGDHVVTGNTTNFLSGTVNMNAPYGRDNMVTIGVITMAVPEPETYAMLLAGMLVLGAVAQRRKIVA